MDAAAASVVAPALRRPDREHRLIEGPRRLLLAKAPRALAPCRIAPADLPGAFSVPLMCSSPSARHASGRSRCSDLSLAKIRISPAGPGPCF